MYVCMCVYIYIYMYVVTYSFATITYINKHITPRPSAPGLPPVGAGGTRDNIFLPIALRMYIYIYIYTCTHSIYIYIYIYIYVYPGSGAYSSKGCPGIIMTHFLVIFRFDNSYDTICIIMTSRLSFFALLRHPRGWRRHPRRRRAGRAASKEARRYQVDPVCIRSWLITSYSPASNSHQWIRLGLTQLGIICWMKRKEEARRHRCYECCARRT